jgi:pimeloyl-ACP methyl ester carboxylesterase
LDADNPTHGVKLARRNTQDGQYDTDAYVTDLLQLADNWPLQRFAIIGHSMGGTNAINFAGALSRTGLSAPKPAQRTYQYRILSLLLERLQENPGRKSSMKLRAFSPKSTRRRAGCWRVAIGAPINADGRWPWRHRRSLQPPHPSPRSRRSCTDTPQALRSAMETHQ